MFILFESIMLFQRFSSKEINIFKIGKWFYKLWYILTIGYHKVTNDVLENNKWCKQMVIV